MQIRAKQSYNEFVAASMKPSGLQGAGESYWNFLETKVERQIKQRANLALESLAVRSKLELLKFRKKYESEIQKV